MMSKILELVRVRSCNYFVFSFVIFILIIAIHSMAVLPLEPPLAGLKSLHHA